MRSRQVYIPTITLVALVAAFCLGQSPDEGVQIKTQVFPKGDEKQGRIVFEVKNCQIHNPDGQIKDTLKI